MTRWSLYASLPFYYLSPSLSFYLDSPSVCSLSHLATNAVRLEHLVTEWRQITGALLYYGTRQMAEYTWFYLSYVRIQFCKGHTCAYFAFLHECKLYFIFLLASTQAAFTIRARRWNGSLDRQNARRGSVKMSSGHTGQDSFENVWVTLISAYGYSKHVVLLYSISSYMSN